MLPTTVPSLAECGVRKEQSIPIRGRGLAGPVLGQWGHGRQLWGADPFVPGGRWPQRCDGGSQCL